MELATVKEYLRIDEDADDNIICLMMEAAQQYIMDAVGSYNKDNPKAKLLFLLVMQDFYENRVLSVKESDKQRLSYAVNTIVMQLQAEKLMEEGAENS